MSVPYPQRGDIPWDKALKKYIDYRDTLGVEGPSGPPGIPGGDTIQTTMTWEVASASSPMDGGCIGAADPPPREATQLITSCYDLDDINRTETIDALKAGDRIHLQVVGDPESWHVYEVMGSAVYLGYNTYSIPVTTESGSPPQTAPTESIEVFTAFQFAPVPGPPGPQGLPGPPGPPGPAGGASYVHDQLEVSDTWVILHNLGRYPSVTVVDSGNTVITPDVHYDSADQVTIFFGSSTSGKAYLS